MLNGTTLTTVDEHNRAFLVLHVALVQDEVSAVRDEAQWCAHVCDAASPLAGVYAFAPSFDAARSSVAETAWAAVTAGELTRYGLTAETLAGIYVVSTTCEVYDGDALTAAIGGDTGCEEAL